MIWALLGVVALMAAAFAYRLGGVPAAGGDPLAPLKAQLADLEADFTRGELDADAYRATKLELQRRLLKAAERPDRHLTANAAPRPATGHGRTGPVLFALAIVLGGAALYGWLGTPGLDSAPGMRISRGATPVTPEGPTFDEAIAAIEDRLAGVPDDVEGWRILARTANALGDYGRAARAYGVLSTLQPDQLQWRVARIESFLAMSRGQVTPAARLLIDRMVRDVPDHPAGRYYLGLALDQAGDEDGAKAVWQALLDRTPQDAPWRSRLVAALRRLGAVPPALSDEILEGVADMSPQDRDAMARGMMARLAARLEETPADADGWLMLARSHLALGEKAVAADVLRKGLGHVSADRTAALQALLDSLGPDASP